QAEPEPEANVTEAPIPPGALVIYSGRSEPLITPVIEAFKAKYPNVEVVLKAGSNGALANALIEEKANPQADVFVTTEVFTVKALNAEGVFANYISPEAANVPKNYKDPNGGWTGVTLRARVIMYNTDLVPAAEAPKSILDLADPKWAGQVAAANSANGSLQAQVAVMQELLGDEQTEAWLTGLLDNDTTFLGGHTDVRKAVGAGEFKLGLVNHYYYYLQKAEGSPVDIVFPDQGEGQMGLIVNASAVGVVKGGQNPEAAERFVDFLLSPEGQELFASLNFEYPIIPGVPLHPDVAPLDGYRIADVNLADDSIDLNTTLDLLEKVGVP
ncbi:MAG TPA: extracellular solute-binding protein, partial [Anaerolineales bacterium]|nr:extracellular solute-binding protein [Anaerolineales bacterium]